MKTIPLTQGKTALVDNEDFERLNQWKWHAHKERLKNRTIWYAARGVWIPQKAGKKQREMESANCGQRL